VEKMICSGQKKKGLKPFPILKLFLKYCRVAIASCVLSCLKSFGSLKQLALAQGAKKSPKSIFSKSRQTFTVILWS
jgi:hypothetical protein